MQRRVSHKVTVSFHLAPKTKLTYTLITKLRLSKGTVQKCNVSIQECTVVRAPLVGKKKQHTKTFCRYKCFLVCLSIVAPFRAHRKTMAQHQLLKQCKLYIQWIRSTTGHSLYCLQPLSAIFTVSLDLL